MLHVSLNIWAIFIANSSVLKLHDFPSSHVCVMSMMSFSPSLSLIISRERVCVCACTNAVNVRGLLQYIRS